MVDDVAGRWVKVWSCRCFAFTLLRHVCNDSLTFSDTMVFLNLDPICKASQRIYENMTNIQTTRQTHEKIKQEGSFRTCLSYNDIERKCDETTPKLRDNPTKTMRWECKTIVVFWQNMTKIKLLIRNLPKRQANHKKAVAFCKTRRLIHLPLQIKENKNFNCSQIHKRNHSHILIILVSYDLMNPQDVEERTYQGPKTCSHFKSILQTAII